MDIIKPTNGQVIGRVTLADEEDTKHAIAAAKRIRRFRPIDQGRAREDPAPAA
jgi:acyl-CoA reductase-like NAD-dependent aldehyde dehydrogenase